MPVTDPVEPSKVPRRRILGLALLGGAATSLSILRAPRTELSGLEPAPIPRAELTRPVPKDQRLIGRLNEGLPTRGYLEKHAHAFSTVRVLDVVELPGLGETAPWLAVAIVGTTNELQIVDPSDGKILHVLEIPSEYGTGLESLVWDPQRRRLYLSIDSTLIMWDSNNPKHVRKIAQIDGATALYSLDVDRSGNVFGGTYPLGAVFRVSNSDKSVRIYKRFADDSDYVRNIAVDEKGNVWAGTGASNPRLFYLDVTSDREPSQFDLPNRVHNGFVSSINVFGSKVVISASGVAPQMVFDRKLNAWIAPIDDMWTHRQISRVKDGHFFALSANKLIRISVDDFKEEMISPISTVTPFCISNLGNRVIVYSQEDQLLNLEIYNVESGELENRRGVKLSPSSFKIQSVVASQNNELYLGGYKAKGIASFSPSSGKIWNSPSGETLIQQIEGMIPFGDNRLYIGSYPGGDIISMNIHERSVGSAYKLLSRLGRKYKQSRPFGWAVNSKNIFFGTVPDYGLAGGVVGMIDPVKDEIVWVIDAKASGIANGHSIVGLCADDEYLFGTTSVRNGYGVPDTKGDGRVFKFHLASKKVVWSRTPVSQAGALYSPVLLGGWLLIADHQGIKVLNRETGSLVATHNLNHSNNAEFRAGWAEAKLAVIGTGGKIVHSAHGKCSIVNLRTRSYHRIGSGDEKFGNRLTVTADGSVYNSLNQTDLVQLDLEPARQRPSE